MVWFAIAPRATQIHDRETISALNGPHPPVRQQALQMDDFTRCILENRPSRVPG
jgi:hypothetical protein